MYDLGDSWSLLCDALTVLIKDEKRARVSAFETRWNIFSAKH